MCVLFSRHTFVAMCDTVVKIMPVVIKQCWRRVKALRKHDKHDQEAHAIFLNLLRYMEMLRSPRLDHFIEWSVGITVLSGVLASLC